MTIRNFKNWLLLALSVQILFTSQPIWADISDSNTSSASAILQLTEMLEKYVHPIDRMLFTFRYEDNEYGNFSPKSLEDLKNREIPWSQRFYDPKIKTGDDVGPGLFVATDITATSTWGKTTPRIFVLPLKAGSKLLEGDNGFKSEQDFQLTDRILNELNCRTPEDRLYRPILTLANVVGAFRTSESLTCRTVIVRAFEKLDIKGILYSFNSVLLKDCRTSGTAVNIVEPYAIDFDKLSYFSADYMFEGSKELTPFFKALFEEGKNDYYTQSLLPNLDIWKSYRNGYGFFNHVELPNPDEFQKWKKASIYKCGPKWSTENDSDKVQRITKYNAEFSKDVDLQNLLVETALIYRAWFEESGGYAHDLISSELNISSINKVRELQFENAFGKIDMKKFGQWRLKLENALHHFDISTVANLLGESFPEISTRDLMMLLNDVLSKFDGQELKNPFLYHTALAEMGVPAKTRHLLYNEYAIKMGLTPIFNGSIPQKIGPSNHDWYEKNLSLYRSVLMTCLEFYRTSPETHENALKGECGILRVD